MAESNRFLSARALTALYAAGDLSPVEYLQDSLAHIQRVNPSLNAVYFLDEDGSLDAARESEKRWQQGTPCGPLDGVPTTVKDALTVTGMPGYRGSAAGDVVIPMADHPAVARMREAGSVIMGKNTMCDYGMLAGGVSSRHGITRNPHDLSCTTGASSSGAAASVAAGIEPLSIGTDIVGSIRLPASYCGLAGLKPSQGRVPFYICSNPSMVAGPLARNFQDVALHMDVLTRPDKRDYSALADDGQGYLAGIDDCNPSGLRVLVLTELGIGAPVADHTAKAVLQVADLLAKAGADVTIQDKPPFKRGEWASAEAFYLTRTLTEMARQPADAILKTPIMERWTRPAASWSAVEHYRHFDAMQQLRDRAHALIDGYDFILLPSTPDTAFPAEQAGADMDQLFESWANTFLFNLTEQPASSIPVAFDKNNLPIGAQIVGQRFDDRGVLAISRFIEKEIDTRFTAPIDQTIR